LIEVKGIALKKCSVVLVFNNLASCIAVPMYTVAVISLMQCKKVVMKCNLFHV